MNTKAAENAEFSKVERLLLRDLRELRVRIGLRYYATQSSCTFQALFVSFVSFC